MYKMSNPGETAASQCSAGRRLMVTHSVEDAYAQTLQYGGSGCQASVPAAPGCPGELETGPLVKCGAYRPPA